MKMLQNRHITPFLTNLMIILAVALSPLFSSFFYLQQPPSGFVKSISNINVIEQLGLQNPAPFEFTDAAAAFLKASCELFDSIGNMILP